MNVDSPILRSMRSHFRCIRTPHTPRLQPPTHHSSNHGTCDEESKTCTCTDDFIGFDCSVAGSLVFNTAGAAHNALSDKFCIVCCSNHAIDLCRQHFKPSDTTVYDQCFKEKGDQCYALCENEIDPAVGPNDQQLACAATAGRVLEELEDHLRPYSTKEAHDILEAAAPVAAAEAAEAKNGAQADGAASTARFLSRQSAPAVTTSLRR